MHPRKQNRAPDNIYVGDWFTWAKVIIRRLDDAEGIALLPTHMPPKLCSLSCPVIVGEGVQALDITWDSKQKGWQFAYRDKTASKLTGGFASGRTNTLLAKYLGRYHGGYCYGPQVVKNL
jgi:hypothetical protein